jgi:hypothetical protein
MDLLKMSCRAVVLALATSCLVLTASVSRAEDFKVFQSEEYGFSLEYPATWVKVDRPKGNYYVQFQAPDLTDNFRNKIHVAAHEPVKDALKSYLQEFRSAIKDLQGKSDKKSQETQQVRIMDEGPFKCDVPGAHYFFIQAYEDKLKIWMDIVIVFYKHEQTLLRISCLAPSSVMEKMQPVFNHVLVSVRFSGAEQPAATAPQPAPPPATSRQPAQREVAPPPPPARPTPAESSVGGQAQPRTRPEEVEPAPERTQRMQPAPAPKPAGPRGPARGTERPGLGIVD